MKGIRITPVTTRAEKRLERGIRESVFIREQSVPVKLEFDEFEEVSEHFLAFMDRKAVGCSRFRETPDGIKFERVAVLRSYRRMGVGETLMEHMMALCRQRGHERAYLHAQYRNRGFYGCLGFQEVGDTFDEAGIMHVKMVLMISSSRIKFRF